MTEGQRLAVEQLHAVEVAGGGVLQVVSVVHASSRNEWLAVEVSIACEHHEVRPGGLDLEAREQFSVWIPPGFPFHRPEVWTLHTRFAGHPHVQWQRHLCLYQAPSTEWDPSDGMYGFLERLESWLADAARGELDPIGAPLHPPVTYAIPGAPRRAVVVRADTPPVITEPWVGFAHLNVVSESRVDIVGWSEWGTVSPPDAAAAVLLVEPLSFEFPSAVRALIDALSTRSVPLRRLLTVMMIAAVRNNEDQPLHVVVGAAMRGVRGTAALRQHLAVWSIDPIIAKALRLAVRAYLIDDEAGREIGDEAVRVILDWAEGAKVDWCRVMEERPEIVVRRDHEAPTRWFADKTVSLWGCGALGGPASEFLARAGVGKLILRDKGLVTPGLLIRQIFEDADIGKAKAVALADRLRRIRPEIEIEVRVKDVLDEPLDSGDWTDGADVLIDTTACEAVLAKLELARWTRRARLIPVVSMAIGHRADRGLVLVSRATHTGGIDDVCRRAKLEVLTRPGFRHYAEEFWPRQRRPIFQPEPGCSEPTFVGGAADVVALAGIMLDELALELSDATLSGTASAGFVTLPHAQRSPADRPVVFRWEPDQVSDDPHSGYEIRIAEPAWREIIAWVKRSRRMAGPAVETGGLLFGERDDAVRVIWVSEVSGPPPDSEAAENGFVCGVEGVSDRNVEKRRWTRDSVKAIGVWHAHPDTAPLPSPTDVRGMAAILDASRAPSARSLLLIIGHTNSGTPTLGTFEFSRPDVELVSLGSFKRACAMQVARRRAPRRRVGLALSGGGARAIAFHLGCLRALHDRGILEQVEVISTVSGGSVVGAMYAYGDESFEDFDRRVVELLLRGLVRGIAKRALASWVAPGALATALTAGVAAKGADAARLALGFGARMLGIDGRRIGERLRRTQPPLRRWVSRTTAFEAALREEIFGTRSLPSPRRGGVEVVVNACELRTGSAFRFGSRESGCWRFGRLLDNEVPVALAVAASAAYPVLLPAIDRELRFVNHEGGQRVARVLLTDGGIFDNLGVTCMEPGRSEDVSFNVYSPEHIIACDAGAGLLTEDCVPYWWPTRMVRAFESVLRKVQNGAYQRLHAHVASGALRGFVLAYLGQQDERLPHRPPDLVPRSAVAHYPTDFAPMSAEAISRLTARGEILTRLLVERYCPEL